MKIYLPQFCQEWLTTNPAEGDILLVAAISLFADQLGAHVYQEWESGDIKSLAWDYEEMQLVKLLNRIEDAGIIETMRGRDWTETIRLSEIGMKKRRVVYGSDAIAVELSHKSQVLWAYFLGRTADILERSHSDNLVAPLDVDKGKYKIDRPKISRKHQTDHVIHHLYGYQLKNKNFKFKS